MRLLVSGGAGFIGGHVVDEAIAQGFEVAVLDNFSGGAAQRAAVPANVRVFAVDLRDRDATFRAVQDFQPELVSHHAAQISVMTSIYNPRLDADINILGGINLVDACIEKAQVRRFVFASSGGAIYGEVPEGKRATEQCPEAPQNPYGISKLTFEKLLGFYRHRGLLSVVLRYSNVYGPRQSPHGEAGVVAQFFAAALDNAPLKVFGRRLRGDDGCLRDYVFVEDVVRHNLHALVFGYPVPLVNVASGVATTTRQLAENVIAITRSKSVVQQLPPRVGDVQRSVLDVTLPGPPATSLDLGLRKTADWLRQHHAE